MNDNNGQTVLIVEDEAELAELYADHLSEEYVTKTASTSGEALVELTTDVDLVLLDRRLPGMSGDELLEHIQNWETDCQVIMVTAVDIDTEIIELPCEGYLQKPVDKDELLSAVQQAFLIDQYERLILEYYETRKKYAALEAEFSRSEVNSEQFDRLETRIEELEAEISETVDAFPDSEMSDAFRGLHQSD